ncbi:hypothetical protein GN958_ATG07647, partial [Phytophthora infestans]
DSVGSDCPYEDILIDDAIVYSQLEQQEPLPTSAQDGARQRVTRSDDDQESYEEVEPDTVVHVWKDVATRLNPSLSTSGFELVETVQICCYANNLSVESEKNTSGTSESSGSSPQQETECYYKSSTIRNRRTEAYASGGGERGSLRRLQKVGRYQAPSSLYVSRGRIEGGNGEKKG